MNLALGLAVGAVGALLIWSGVVDAPGGPMGLLGTILRAEPLPKPKAAPTAEQLTGAADAAAAASAGGGGGGATATTGGASAKGAAIVAEAQRQLGKPYQWGAEGPNSFDCSGLVYWCLIHAGIDIERTTTEGYRVHPKGQAVTSPAPGDVVSFGVPAYHDGIALGGGQMIHAPHTGDVVRVAPIAGRSGPVSYRRFG